jgi:hypothetical protein
MRERNGGKYSQATRLSLQKSERNYINHDRRKKRMRNYRVHKPRHTST